MQATDMSEALKMIMADQGWSQVRLARELGRDQPWVSRVVRGHKDPKTREAAELLAKVGWELRITRKSDKGGVEDDSVKRREFLAGTASTLLISSPKTTPFHDPSFVEELTRRTVQAHHQIGSNSSLATTVARQARKISSISDSGGRALQSAASEFMRRGAWVLRQAGRPDLAVQLAKSALHLAEQAKDPDKQAMACSALGLMNIEPDVRYLSRSRNDTDSSKGTPRPSSRSAGQAVEYARRGLAIPGIGDEPRAFLLGLRACGLANAPRKERETRRTVEEALNIDAIPIYDRADILGIAGNAFRDIGENGEALKLLEAAINLGASHSPYLSGRYLGDQIMMLLDMRDPGRAASLMNTLSCIVPLVDSTVLDRKVEQILQATKPWSAVREIREAGARLRSVRMTPDPA